MIYCLIVFGSIYLSGLLSFGLLAIIEYYLNDEVEITASNLLLILTCSIIGPIVPINIFFEDHFDDLTDRISPKVLFRFSKSKKVEDDSEDVKIPENFYLHPR